MRKNYFGSRLPMVNYLVSKFIFFMLNVRLFNLILRNKLKQKISPIKEIQKNNLDTNVIFLKLLNLGYDKLNIGGGTKELSGFINVDFVKQPMVERQVVANILDLSFIPDNCASHIHSNHVIEHLTISQISNQLQEWKRILKNSGLITIRCPNALGCAYGFWFEPIIESSKEEFIKLGFPPDENLSNPKDRWMYKDFFALMHWFYGDKGNMANQHLSQLTPTKLSELIIANKFDIIKMSEPEAVNLVIIARKI